MQAADVMTTKVITVQPDAQGRKFAGLWLKHGIVNGHRRPREETVIPGQTLGPFASLRKTLEDAEKAVAPAGFELERPVDLRLISSERPF